MWIYSYRTGAANSGLVWPTSPGHRSNGGLARFSVFPNRHGDLNHRSSILNRLDTSGSWSFIYFLEPWLVETVARPPQAIASASLPWQARACARNAVEWPSVAPSAPPRSAFGSSGNPCCDGALARSAARPGIRGRGRSVRVDGFGRGARAEPAAGYPDSIVFGLGALVAGPKIGPAPIAPAASSSAASALAGTVL